MTGAVFRDTVRFTGELDAGTLTVKKFFNGNKYITTKYKYKYKYIKMYLSISTSTKYPISGSQGPWLRETSNRDREAEAGSN